MVEIGSDKDNKMSFPATYILFISDNREIPALINLY